MGNQACCEVRNTEYQSTYPPESIDKVSILEQKGSTKQQDPVQQKIQPPKLSYHTEERLRQYKDRQDKLGNDPKSKAFGKEVYIGELDQALHIPSGYGKIYKQDGSVYLGEWQRGKAHGHGVYILKDGSVYDGTFQENIAEGIGKFISKSFYYEGHFINNNFEGIGTQKDEGHSFHGEYHQGCKVKGTFTWKDEDKQYEYIGQFNRQGQFEGKGKLKEPNGTYDGDFAKGQKHGKGNYRFENGLRYQGEYVDGKKDGKGTLFNCNDSIAYDGDFSDDIPHGQGFVYDAKGNKMKRKWVRGLDSEGIQ